MFVELLPIRAYIVLGSLFSEIEAMAKDDRVLRLKLFDTYSTNFSIYHPESCGEFQCPVCSRIFDRSAAESNPPRLAIAHVFPHARGGKQKTLSCKDCDSDIGSHLDSKLARQHDYVDWVEGRRSERVWLTMPVGRIRVDSRRDGNNHWFSMVPGNSNPAHEHSVMSHCHETAQQNGQLEFSITHTVPDPGLPYLALLHSAHLAMFRLFGYEYIGTPSAEKIVRLITDKEPIEGVPFPILRFTDWRGNTDPFETISLCPLLGFCVAIFRSPSTESVAIGIALPGFGKKAEEKFAEIISGNKTLQVERAVSFDHSFWSERLSNTSNKDWGHRLFS